MPTGRRGWRRAGRRAVNGPCIQLNPKSQLKVNQRNFHNGPLSAVLPCKNWTKKRIKPLTGKFLICSMIEWYWQNIEPIMQIGPLNQYPVNHKVNSSSIHLQIQWKNRTDRGSGGFHWISVEFSATWQLHFHWNPPEHAVFSLAENVFGVDDFRPMRVQCLLNV